MRKQKAFGILQELIKKPTDAAFDFDSWKLHVSSIIEKFFGKESAEYKALNKPTITFHSGYETELEKRQVRQTEIKKICSVLLSAAETVKIKGVFRQPKQNIVSNLDNYKLIGVGVGLVAFGFAAHQFFDSLRLSANKSIQNRYERKEATDSTINFQSRDSLAHNK